MEKENEIESLKLEIKALKLQLEIAESQVKHWKECYKMADEAFHKAMNKI